MNSTTTCYKPVTNRTRSRLDGKWIKCPKCSQTSKVYHFSGAGLTCPNCKESTDKLDWLVESN